jgi:murein DD-endopeptidase MepM/ murein hydrolase activator NlpD
MQRINHKFFILFLLAIFFNIGIFSYTQAQSISELEQQIKVRAEERQDLEVEAERIRIELTKVGAEKGTLTAELNRINSERKSLDNNIRQTQNDINFLDLKIDKSEERISRYNSEILTHAGTIAGLLRGVDQRSNLSLLELVVSGKRFSNFFSIRDSYARIQKSLIATTNILKEKKIDLRKTNQVLSLEQQDLEEEKEILGDQKNIVQEQEKIKETVLNRTKQKENTTKKSLNSTLAIIAALNTEIRSFESKLKFALNPNSIPQKGSAVFEWPLSKVLITQRFGKTSASGRLYASGSHSGMDFRASVGTPVYAVADGVVKGTGNTDDQCYRASFGKWVFIEHSNGLSTTSAHLSSIKAKAGQNVKKGDIIAYSGNTGRSTAPHLHITTYATKGVDGGQGARITDRPSSACPGTNYRMPLAPTAAYLDPLSFFPKTNISYYKYPSLAN